MKTEINFDEFVRELLHRIDISPTQFKTAESHYEAVANYLEKGGVADDIYVQGSFAYGTVIRPFRKGKDADYDIDLVSQVLKDRHETSPATLKKNVKQCLEESPYHGHLLSKEEGRRCWTLNYEPKDGICFHMDVLPCASESAEIIGSIIHKGVPSYYANTAIAITDKDKKTGVYSWASSNARGLAKWFMDINAPYLAQVADTQRRTLVHDGIYASVDKVPNPVLRSSLQRVIQLLKRHRDCRFDGSPIEEYKPISMVITILAATIAKQKAFYSATILELLSVVVQELSRFSALLEQGYDTSRLNLDKTILSRDQTGWRITNPVNPNENFAERWAEDDNARAKAFFQWVRWLSTDFNFDGKKSGDYFELLGIYFGKSVVSEAYDKLNLNPLKAPVIITSTKNMPKPYRA